MRGFKESTAHIKEVRRTRSGAKCSLLSPTGHHDEGNAQPLIQLAEALRVHGPGPVDQIPALKEFYSKEADR